MKTTGFCSLLLAITLISCQGINQAGMQDKILLKDNWAIQSSDIVKEDGNAISMTGFKPEKWYPATVPSTVFGTLVENKVYPDPYYGTNIESVPGYTTNRRGNMPSDSPFRVAWWYRPNRAAAGRSTAVVVENFA